MVMEPPCNRSLCVEKEKVAADVVVFKETRSSTDIVIETPCTRPCNMARLIAPALKRSTLVLILSPELFVAIGRPVVSSPAANVMLCGPPAGSVPPDVVHTILSVAVVIKQLDSVADPECAASTPTGALF